MEKKYPFGNKNAEKWTEETVLAVLYECLEDCLSNDIYSLSTIISNRDLYPQWWSEMTEKFINNTTVSEAIKKVENAIESNIIANTMTGEAKSAAMAIFLLKNKFGYVDKSERATDITTNGKSFNIKDIYGGSEDTEA